MGDSATVVIVDRIVRKERVDEARGRIHQALMRIFINFLHIADFVLADYLAMHPTTY
jgi:hypothetical protein